MTKKFITVIIALCFVLGTLGAYAVGDGIAPRASYYLNDYSLVMVADGDGQMSVSYTVCATNIMTKVGAQSIEIQRGSSSGWTTVKTYYGSENADFYSYDKVAHAGDVFFEGEVGKTYRAILTAYAGNSSGSDTATLTCTAKVCK